MIKMREELFEEILSLVEEYINELDALTMQSANDKRKENWEKSLDDYLKASKEGDEEKKEKENLKSFKARKKWDKNTELMNKRLEKKLADFKEKLVNKKPQTAKETQQAGSDHDNAIIDQHLRNKLEKAFSNECFESLISLIEGELIDFQEKRKQKVLDKNAEKMAKMMQDGSLNAVRVLPNMELIGDPAAIKKVKDIQKENDEVLGRTRKHG
jgi:hypothetical protein